jgi:hypothetical protein
MQHSSLSHYRRPMQTENNGTILMTNAMKKKSIKTYRNGWHFVLGDDLI